jgi:DNA-binding transcriptional ArsR family regulator
MLVEDHAGEARSGPDIAAVAALVGEPARARMLAALMAGRALTATELALEAGVAPSTASSHLDKLTRAGLVSPARQGRHRYFSLASPDVARALEGLMAIAPQGDARRGGPRDAGIRRARVCYDHLAGELGVELLERLRARRWVHGAGERLTVSGEGEQGFAALGIDVAELRGQRRPLARCCLDWSERRFHLAGALGAALLERMLALRLARRESGSRAVVFTARGEEFLGSFEARLAHGPARWRGKPRR